MMNTRIWDRRTGNIDILDMVFISPNLTKHDIHFLIGDDLGGDHLPIEITIDAQPHRNIHNIPVIYKFNQTDREVFESTLEAALSRGDVPQLKSTQDIDNADFIITVADFIITVAVDKAIPTSKSGRPESLPASDETLVCWFHGSSFKGVSIVFQLPDWLKLNHLKSRMECGFSDIFSCHFCSTVAKTITLTNYTARFGAKKCSENHI